MKTNVVFHEEVSPKGDTFSMLVKLCNVLIVSMYLLVILYI